jgi:hypothetical protein
MNNNNISRLITAFDGQQSLLSAINRFVQAVDAMDDVVMIPCRLRDIPVETVSTPNVREENNNKAVISTSHLNGDLYHFYVMLHAIRSEIIAGPKSLEQENMDNFTEDKFNENDPINENARKTAALFRHHLRGLFGLLHQMTETSQVLSSRYEKEVSSAQTETSSVSSFNM